ncbi:MAG: DNA repair protein RecN [Chloroflexi bacterium]|nr:DNA repair protein RecN [Chloroflexota bacterium]
MLSELTISNFAIIDHLRLTMSPGFTVLTGETGAGKSIIIDAVSTLLGGRADVELIRSGTEGARIEGVFVLSPALRDELMPFLREHGLDESGDTLILTREINRNGRHVCRVNGRTVTLSVFSQIGERLVDIHGQGEHLSLLRVKEHLNFLDRYGGLQEQRAMLAEQVRRLRRVREELAALRRDERELARRADLLQYQIREIEDAKLRPGEEEELLAERKLLLNAGRLSTLANAAFQKLGGGNEEQYTVVDLLGSVLRDLTELERLDAHIAPQRQMVEEVSYQLDDLAHTLRSYRDRIEFNPVRLQIIEERLDLIHNLKRKYGNSIAEVLHFAEEAAKELHAITHNEERIAALQEEEARLVVDIGAQAAALSTARRQAANRLELAVERELDELNMKQARFVVDMQWREADDGVVVEGKRYACDLSGIDHVEFLISPNVGEPPKPLAKIASGGETSRLMLALKTVLSTVDEVPTLIFDEIDQGIGGRAGGIVGRKLWGLTAKHQVLCVTHLPQLACYGDVHYKVNKVQSEGRTVTRAQVLDEQERIEELAAMLGGPPGEARQRSAREMYEETLAIKGERTPIKA